MTDYNLETESEAATGREASAVERIVSCLRNKYTLVNRGTGWYLAPKYIPYRSQSSELISDEIVERMEKEGIVKVEIPYNSARAVLCD